MILGVVLHAVIPYMSRPMPGAVWPVHEPSGWAFDALFWGIHTVRLPLFFLLSGFFAAGLAATRGARGFLDHRSRRLLQPLVAGGLVLLPLTYVVWSWGWISTGQLTPAQAATLQVGAETERQLFGPAHLWFLIDLYAMCLVLYGVAVRAPRTLNPLKVGPLRRLLLTGWAPLLLAVPGALVLAVAPHTYVEHRNTFFPDPARLLYYGTFFAAGVLLHPLQRQFSRLARQGSLFGAAAVTLLALQGVLLSRMASGTLLPLALVTPLAAWTGVFALVSLALAWEAQVRPSFAYLSDASYWTYLVHLPLVGAFGVLLHPTELPAGLKLVLVVSGTVALSLASYQAVRHTRVGECLHGPRRREPAPAGRAARSGDPRLNPEPGLPSSG